MLRRIQTFICRRKLVPKIHLGRGEITKRDVKEGILVLGEHLDKQWQKNQTDLLDFLIRFRIAGEIVKEDISFDLCNGSEIEKYF